MTKRGDIRKFNGKKYVLEQFHFKKSKAKRIAKNARKHGIPTRIIEGKAYGGKTAYFLYAELEAWKRMKKGLWENKR